MFRRRRRQRRQRVLCVYGTHKCAAETASMPFDELWTKLHACVFFPFVVLCLLACSLVRWLRSCVCLFRSCFAMIYPIHTCVDDLPDSHIRAHRLDAQRRKNAPDTGKHPSVCDMCRFWDLCNGCAGFCVHLGRFAVNRFIFLNYRCTFFFVLLVST